MNLDIYFFKDKKIRDNIINSNLINKKITSYIFLYLKIIYITLDIIIVIIDIFFNFSIKRRD